MRIPVAEREERARVYDLDESINLESDSLQEVRAQGMKAWSNLKTAVTENIPGLLKWWTNSRF